MESIHIFVEKENKMQEKCEKVKLNFQTHFLRSYVLVQ